MLERMTPEGHEWNGDSRFFLAFEHPNGNTVGIDLDTSGWIEEQKDLFRAAGTWFLVDKGTGQPLFVVCVGEGDQFFFTKHHTGNLMAGGSLMSYGCGKKQADGRAVELWFLPNGMVCGTEYEVDLIASRMLG